MSLSDITESGKNLTTALKFAAIGGTIYMGIKLIDALAEPAREVKRVAKGIYDAAVKAGEAAADIGKTGLAAAESVVNFSHDKVMSAYAVSQDQADEIAGKYLKDGIIAGNTRSVVWITLSDLVRYAWVGPVSGFIVTLVAAGGMLNARTRLVVQAVGGPVSPGIKVGITALIGTAGYTTLRDLQTFFANSTEVERVETGVSQAAGFGIVSLGGIYNLIYAGISAIVTEMPNLYYTTRDPEYGVDVTSPTPLHGGQIGIAEQFEYGHGDEAYLEYEDIALADIPDWLVSAFAADPAFGRLATLALARWTFFKNYATTRFRATDTKRALTAITISIPSGIIVGYVINILGNYIVVFERTAWDFVARTVNQLAGVGPKMPTCPVYTGLELPICPVSPQAPSGQGWEVFVLGINLSALVALLALVRKRMTS